MIGWKHSSMHKAFTLGFFLFFSCQVFSQTTNRPGGETTAPKIWFRADDPGATPITSWKDQMAAFNAAATGTFVSPLGNASAFMNFNPSYSFNGTTNYFSANSFTFSSGNHEIFIVAMPALGGGSHVFNMGASNQTSIHSILNNGTNQAKGFQLVNDNYDSKQSNAPLGTYADRPVLPQLLFLVGAAGTLGINGNYAIASYSNGIFPSVSNSATVSVSNVFTLNNFTIGAARRSSPTVGSTPTLISGSTFKGNIAEVILYDRGKTTANLTEGQRYKIRTYLALKYGITLNHDYIDNTGTTIYPFNQVYNKNVVGIGRIDAMTLNQRQSIAANSTSLLMIGNNNIIDLVNGNSALSGNDIANGNYLIIGDNGFTPGWNNSGAPSLQYQILNRIWKVKQGGTGITSVKLSFFNENATGRFPEGVIPNAKTSADKLYLLTSTDDDFTTTGDNTITPLVLSANGQTWDVNTPLSSNQIFTIIRDPFIQVTPGDVKATLALWFKADDPGSAPTTTWEDRSGNVQHVTASGGILAPSNSGANGINFNPSYSFNGSTQFFTRNNYTLMGNYSQEHFVVNLNRDGASVKTALSFGTSFNSTSQTNPFETNSGKPQSSQNTNSAITGANNLTNQSVLGNYSRNILATTNNATLSYFGNNLNETKAANISATDAFNQINVGANRLIAVNNQWWNGNIAEVISYNQTLTSEERSKVRTYLAVKYGITLNHDYLSSSAVKLWDYAANVAYNNNIFGIGRDNAQALHQRQSQSSNPFGLLAIGNNNIIDNTNGNSSVSGNDLATDNSYLVLGDNYSPSVKTKWTSTGAPAGQFSILTRVWKSQETGTIGSVKMSFYNGTSGRKAEGFIPNAKSAEIKLFLYVSPDASFSDDNNTITPLTLSADGKTWDVNVDLSGTQYFTLVKGLEGPGAISEGPVLWLKANLPGATPTTKWEDMSGNVADATAVGTPSVASNSVNFNPVYQFNGTNQ